MSNVILINPIEVQAAEKEQFLSIWQTAAEHMRHAPGFRSLRLHKSVDSQAKFRFVNVAEWESAQQWQEAVKSQPVRITEEMREKAALEVATTTKAKATRVRITRDGTQDRYQDTRTNKGDNDRSNQSR